MTPVFALAVTVTLAHLAGRWSGRLATLPTRGRIWR